MNQLEFGRHDKWDTDRVGQRISGRPGGVWYRVWEQIVEILKTGPSQARITTSRDLASCWPLPPVQSIVSALLLEANPSLFMGQLFTFFLNTLVTDVAKPARVLMRQMWVIAYLQRFSKMYNNVQNTHESPCQEDWNRDTTRCSSPIDYISSATI